MWGTIWPKWVAWRAAQGRTQLGRAEQSAASQKQSSFEVQTADMIWHMKALWYCYGTFFNMYCYNLLYYYIYIYYIVTFCQNFLECCTKLRKLRIEVLDATSSRPGARPRSSRCCEKVNTFFPHLFKLFINFRTCSFSPAELTPVGGAAFWPTHWRPFASFTLRGISVSCRSCYYSLHFITIYYCQLQLAMAMSSLDKSNLLADSVWQGYLLNLLWDQSGLDPLSS